jgi:hypothetical protein
MARVLIAAGLAGFLAALLTTVIAGVPVPQIHDEFSYLLAADTYAHGRLTNPPHPLWPWFETFHVLQQPTYMSKYLPGQGLFLALGQLIGLPIAGVWLSAALACAAVTWMLLPWMGQRWALGGGALVALHPAMLGWSHSYWGPAVAIFGGALVVGDVGGVHTPPPADGGRCRGRGRVENPSHIGLLLGLGAVLLANSRPWEGFVLVATVLLLVRLPWRALFAAAIVVALGGAFMLYDNQRVTHDPLLLPYALYERQYNFTPPLVWQKTHPVALRQKTMQFVSDAFYYEFYKERHSVAGFLRSIPGTLAAYGNGAFQFVPDAMLVRVMSPAATIALTVAAFVLAVPLFVPFIFVVRAIRRDRTLKAMALVLVIGSAVALLSAVFPQAHYAGPFVPLFVLVWLAGLREMADRRAVVAVVALWLLGAVLFFASDRYRWGEVGQRLAVERGFASKPGRHVVVVRYLSSHNPQFEWVHNAADIDGQRVVWAHDMGDNAPLVDYYKDRRAWLLTVGDRAPVLEPFGRSPAPAPRPPATPAPAAGV